MQKKNNDREIIVARTKLVHMIILCHFFQAAW